jgi:hypothetical protein
MKKWSLILWFAAIVGAASIFMACGEDDSDEGETFTDVTGLYTLKASEATDAGTDASGLTIASAKKSNSTENVTIVLTGTVKEGYRATATVSGGTSTVALGGSLGTDWTNTWGSAEVLFGAEPGVYGAAYIDGIITQPIVNAGTLAIKQTNEAFRVYSGSSSAPYAATAPTATVVPPSPHSGFVPKALWVPYVGSTGVSVRWKAYVNGDTGAPTQGVEPFGILIWDGGTATPKYSRVATLEIETTNLSGTVSGGGSFSAAVKDVLATYIIDYSGVVFGTP